MRIIIVLLLVGIIACKPKPIHEPILISTFYDLQGNGRQSKSTQVSLIFDEKGIEFIAILDEDDIQAKIEQHDTLIYLDPCIELFLDPGADGLDYYEVEMNALGYGWALKLASNDSPINASANISDWNINRAYSSKMYGTVNDNSDTYEQWVATILCPWTSFTEGAPESGDVWAYNIMRVDYDGSIPSYWVAKPTGESMIHFPEYWPSIQF